MSTEKKEAVAGGLYQSEIDTLRKQYGPLTLITVEGNHWWFRKPDMATLSASAAVSDRDPVASLLVYFNNCLVKGDASAADNVDVWIAIAPHLSTLIEEKKSEVKKF